MADRKVHPMPSAPPYSRSSSMGARTTISSLGIQMPDVEHATKREEEQSLMHAYGYGERVALQQQKDFIYKVPLPLPPNHPSRRARRRQQKGKQRGSCGRCCCCVGILCAILAAIIIILSIAALVIYLVLQPKTPDFSVSDATINSFNVSMQPVSAANAIPGVYLYLNADVTFNVLTENPNKKIGIFYDAIDVTLLYEGLEIGNGSIPAFYQGHQNTTLLVYRMKGQDVGMTPAIGLALQTSLNDANSSFPLHTRIDATVRIKVGGWESRASKFQIDCDVEMSNPTAPHPHLLSKRCSFKVKNLMI